MPIHWQHDFTCFCTLRHYVTVNLKVNENHVQYVHSKMDDPLQYIVWELSYHKYKNWTKNLWKSRMGRGPRMTWMTFEQRERAIGMLTAGMSARDIAWHFQPYESTISPLLNRFQQTEMVADWPRSGRRRKTTPHEDRFLMNSSGRNRKSKVRSFAEECYWLKSLRQDSQE